MLVIKHLQRILILFRRRRPLPLMLPNQVLEFLWELAQMLEHAFFPERLRRRGVGDNEATEAFGMTRGHIVGSKHTTPGLA